MCDLVCFFQAEDGIRDLVRSRGLGDVYKRQPLRAAADGASRGNGDVPGLVRHVFHIRRGGRAHSLSLIHI